MHDGAGGSVAKGIIQRPWRERPSGEDEVTVSGAALKTLSPLLKTKCENPKTMRFKRVGLICFIKPKAQANS